MAQAKFPSEVAQRIFDLINHVTNKANLITADGTLFYGDQDRLPTSPTVCVEAGPTVRPMASAAKPGGMVENQHEAYILVYYGSVQSNQDNKIEAEQLAEGIVAFFDSNVRLEGPAGEEGIVIHGWCTSIDPGYSIKEGTLWTAVRIVWQGISKTVLGS